MCLNEPVVASLYRKFEAIRLIAYVAVYTERTEHLTPQAKCQRSETLAYPRKEAGHQSVHRCTTWSVNLAAVSYEQAIQMFNLDKWHFFLELV